MTQIYLDNAATTPLLDEVIDAMVVVMKTISGILLLHIPLVKKPKQF
jgi:hypothetical protein